MSEEEKKNSYAWTVKNVKKLYEDKVSLRSSNFSTKISNELSINWRLIMTINEPEPIKKTVCHNNSKEHVTLPEETLKRPKIALYLQSTDKVHYVPPIIKITFSIIHPFDGKIFSKSKTVLDVLEYEHYGFLDFISFGELDRLKLVNLVILCEVEQVNTDYKSYTSFLKNNDFSDIELILNEEKYPAHKKILAISSQLFKDTFANDDSISSLKILDIEPKVFNKVLEYMYRGSVNPEGMYSKIFKAAKTYKIHGLISEVKSILVFNIRSRTVFDTLLTCNASQPYCDMVDVKDHCWGFLTSNFKNIMHCRAYEDWTCAKPKLLVEILMKVRYALNVSKCKRKTTDPLIDSVVPIYSQRVYELYLNNETLSDIKIHVGDNEYPAHKLVLAARSPVFSKMFSHPMTETTSGVVKIEDIRPEVFYELLRFMYSDKFEYDYNYNLLWEILLGAEKYEIHDLKFDCENIFRRVLNTTNVFQYITRADSCNAVRLKNICIWYVIDKVLLNGNFSNNLEILFGGLGESHPNLILEILKKMALDYKLVFCKA